jgi:hypothetical protein
VNRFDGGSGDDYAYVSLAGETRSVSFSSAAAASSSGQDLVDGGYVRNVERSL